jgi:hypothetical protein
VISRDQLIEEMGKAYYRLRDPRQRITPLVRMRAAMDKHPNSCARRKRRLCGCLRRRKEVQRCNISDRLAAAIADAEEALK